MTAELSAVEAKACCAAAYSNDAVALILGESYHPGGLTLTRRLARLTGLRSGQRVLDVASGPGSTSLLLAAEFGVSVDGVDLADASVRRATATAADAGLGDRVTFHVGDAERLPFGDASVDAVVCECAFCTFPDKVTASELARVLRPGGQLGLSDVTVAAGGLPPELAGIAGWVACIADARPLEEYAAILTSAGLDVLVQERHDEALARMVDQIDAGVRLVRAVGSAQPAIAGIDWGNASRMIGLASDAVRVGADGYALLIAQKPGKCE